MMQYRKKTYYYEDFYLYLQVKDGFSFYIGRKPHQHFPPEPRPRRGRTSPAGTAHGMHDPEGGRILYFFFGGGGESVIDVNIIDMSPLWG